MKSATKRTVCALWTVLAFLASELGLFLSLSLPFRFGDCLLFLVLVASSFAALLLLYRDSAPMAGKLILGWAIAAGVLFIAVNIASIAADGSPALLYRGRTLWCTVPLLLMTALAWLLVWARKGRVAGAKHRTGLCRRSIMIGLCLMAYVGWVAGALVYTHSAAAVEEVSVPIPAFSVEPAGLNAFLCAEYPDDCANKPLTGIRLDAALKDGRATAGLLYMEYSRLINDRRAGGNVESACFCIDIVKGRVISVERYKGARLARAFCLRAVEEEALRFPYAWYIERAAALAGAPADDALRLYCAGDAAGVTLRVQRDGVRLYEATVSYAD